MPHICTLDDYALVLTRMTVSNGVTLMPNDLNLSSVMDRASWECRMMRAEKAVIG